MWISNGNYQPSMEIFWVKIYLHVCRNWYRMANDNDWQIRYYKPSNSLPLIPTKIDGRKTFPINPNRELIPHVLQWIFTAGEELQLLKMWGPADSRREAGMLHSLKLPSIQGTMYKATDINFKRISQPKPYASRKLGADIGYPKIIFQIVQHMIMEFCGYLFKKGEKG